jgi:hypothetical protein
MDQGGVCWPGRIRLVVKTHRIVTSIELVTGNRRYAQLTRVARHSSTAPLR